MKNIKIAYIGGGSKQWARVFMNDLALCSDLTGEIGLFDIDKEAAVRNQQIGNNINKQPETVSRWNYVVYDSLKEVLCGADFVVISILPGTFEDMRVDVHYPEKYNISREFLRIMSFYKFPKKLLDEQLESFDISGGLKEVFTELFGKAQKILPNINKSTIFALLIDLYIQKLGENKNDIN